MTTVKPKRVVRDIMDRGDWTLARLGRRLSLSRERMRQIVNKEDGPGIHGFNIAAALGVKPGELVDAEGRWRTL